MFPKDFNGHGFLIGHYVLNYERDSGVHCSGTRIQANIDNSSPEDHAV